MYTKEVLRRVQIIKQIDNYVAFMKYKKTASALTKMHACNYNEPKTIYYFGYSYSEKVMVRTRTCSSLDLEFIVFNVGLVRSSTS